MIEPSNGKSLFIRLNGYYLRRYNPLIQVPLSNKTMLRSISSNVCSTKARVVITTGDMVQITGCPTDSDESTNHIVEVFSAGWNKRFDFEAIEYSQVISVEYLEPEDGNFIFSWLELSKLPAQGFYGNVHIIK